MENENLDSVQLIYWKCRLIMDLIRSDGGKLTTRVFIPKDLWVQESTRIPGINTKNSVFSRLVEILGDIRSNGIPRNERDWLTQNRIFKSLVESELPSMKNKLHSHFSWIPYTTPATTKTNMAENVDDKTSFNEKNNTSKRGFQRFKHFTSALIKKSTYVAKYVEDNVLRPTTSGELKIYSDTVASLLDASQFLWKLYNHSYLHNPSSDGMKQISITNVIDASSNSKSDGDGVISRIEEQDSATTTSTTATAPILVTSVISHKNVDSKKNEMDLTLEINEKEAKFSKDYGSMETILYLKQFTDFFSSIVLQLVLNDIQYLLERTVVDSDKIVT